MIFGNKVSKKLIAQYRHSKYKANIKLLKLNRIKMEALILLMLLTGHREDKRPIIQLLTNSNKKNLIPKAS
jgi:hypothetical protein